MALDQQRQRLRDAAGFAEHERVIPQRGREVDVLRRERAAELREKHGVELLRLGVLRRLHEDAAETLLRVQRFDVLRAELPRSPLDHVAQERLGLVEAAEIAEQRREIGGGRQRGEFVRPARAQADFVHVAVDGFRFLESPHLAEHAAQVVADHQCVIVLAAQRGRRNLGQRAQIGLGLAEAPQHAPRPRQRVQRFHRVAVVVAEQAALLRQHGAEDALRRGRPTQLCQDARKHGLAGEREGALVAAPIERLDDRPEELAGAFELAALFRHLRQRDAQPERFVAIVGQMQRAEVEPADEKRIGLVEPACANQAARVGASQARRFEQIVGWVLAFQPPGLRAMREILLREPQCVIGVGDRPMQLLANGRVADLRRDTRRGAIERLAHFEIGPTGFERAAAADDVDPEFVDLAGDVALQLGLVPRERFGRPGCFGPFLLISRVLARARRDVRHSRGDHHPRGKRDDDRRRGRDRQPMPLREFSKLIHRRGRSRLNRLALQVPANVGRECGGGRIAALGILLQRFADDGVDVAAQARVERRGPRRRHFANDPQRLRHGHAREVVRQPAAHQLVENHAERVDVGAYVDVAARALLGAHVVQRADQLAHPGILRDPGLLRIERAGHAEIDHLRPAA